MGSRSVRSVLSRLLDRIPLARRVHPKRLDAQPDWLTKKASSFAEPRESWPPTRVRTQRPLQHESLLGMAASEGAVRGEWYGHNRGLERRQPYRDRRLVQFALAMPAHQFYERGFYKAVLRNAMRGILPDQVRLRRHPTSLMPLLKRGLSEHEAGTMRQILLAPDAVWPQYVRREWLQARLPVGGFARTQPSEYDQAIMWCCVCLELWQRRFSY